MWKPLPFTEPIRDESERFRITKHHAHEFLANPFLPPDLLFGLRCRSSLRMGVVRIGEAYFVSSMVLRVDTTRGIFMDESIYRTHGLKMDIFGAMVLLKYLRTVGNRWDNSDNEITSPGKRSRQSLYFVRSYDGAEMFLGYTKLK